MPCRCFPALCIVLALCRQVSSCDGGLTHPSTRTPAIKLLAPVMSNVSPQLPEFMLTSSLTFLHPYCVLNVRSSSVGCLLRCSIDRLAVLLALAAPQPTALTHVRHLSKHRLTSGRSVRGSFTVRTQPCHNSSSFMGRCIGQLTPLRANPSINTDASDKAAGAGYVKRWASTDQEAPRCE